MKKVIASILAALLVLSLFGCQKKGNDLDINGSKDTGTSATPETGPDQALSDGNASDSDGISSDESSPAIWTETTTVSEHMFVYFYNSYYRHFVETYKAELADMGLDTSRSLSEQMQSEEYTWQQYITIQVYDQLCEMIALADKAKAEGISLSAEDDATIKTQMSSYILYASNSGVSVDSYLENAYGKGVNEAAVKKALELRLLANKYYEILKSSYTFTEEDCAAHYSENEADFLHYNSISITVPDADVSALTAATDEESFISAIRTALTKNIYNNDYDRFASSIEAAVKRAYSYGTLCNKDTALGKWLLEDGRAPYQIHSESLGNGNTTVTMILPAEGEGTPILYKNEGATKNFRYIAFTDSEGFDSITKAETIYKNWSENPTEKRFEELCKQHGGSLAESVSVGGSNESLNQWIFSPDRAVGDCTIIDADNCTYLIYMLEDGDPAWLIEVRGALTEAALKADIKAITEACNPEYNGDFVYNVLEVSIAESKS